MMLLLSHQVQQKVKLEQEMTQLNIPSSLMVTPVSCPPPPPGASAHTQHQTPPPVVSMATITKVVAPPLPITQQLPPPAGKKKIAFKVQLVLMFGQVSPFCDKNNV